MLIIKISKSSRKGKKWMASIYDDRTRRTKTVHFGCSGMKDYTQHKDPDRMKRYVSRHSSRENWTKSGITTAGFWSRWLLWNKPSLKTSASSIASKFKVRISFGSSSRAR